jgi:hypothetical protein
VTFNETAISTIGRSDICFPKLQMDYDGVAYAIIAYNGIYGGIQVQRGTWVQLGGLPGAPASTYIVATASAIFVDPRNGY